MVDITMYTLAEDLITQYTIIHVMIMKQATVRLTVTFIRNFGHCKLS